MRLSDYDKAVIRYFEALFPNTVFGYQQRQLWHAAEDSQKVEVTLPLIGINRVTQTFLFDSYNNEPHVIRGAYEPGLGATVRHIPLHLAYQLDLYSNSREEVDDLWRELVREMLDNRTLNVDVIWDDNKKVRYQFPIALRTSPVDNTDVLRFTDTNKLYRITQDFVIEQAKLFFAEKPESGDGLIHSIPIKQIVLERNIDCDTYTVTSLPGHQ